MLFWKILSLFLKGRYLNLVAEKWDVRVSVGMGSCEVIELTENNLTCVPPLQQPAPGMSEANYPEVNVRYFNFKKATKCDVLSAAKYRWRFMGYCKILQEQ